MGAESVPVHPVNWESSGKWKNTCSQKDGPFAAVFFEQKGLQKDPQRPVAAQNQQYWKKKIMYKKARIKLTHIESAKSKVLSETREVSRGEKRLSPLRSSRTGHHAQWRLAQLVLATDLSWMEEKKLWCGKSCYLWHFLHRKDTYLLENYTYSEINPPFGKFWLSARL